jgi:hypothetical protein
MTTATISRVRLHDPTPPGRFAAPRRTATNAASIGAGTPRRPIAASSRPGAGDLVAVVI